MSNLAISKNLMRSWLFVPGNHPRKVKKVFELGADVVILDLEDAVAISEKVDTRVAVLTALENKSDCLGYVRINALDTPFAFRDLDAVAYSILDGVVVPKVECASDLKQVDWVLSNLESERGITAGSIDIVPIIETAKGLDAIDEIAGAGTRVKRLSFGGGDFTRDMGIKWSGAEAELAHARSRFVLASRVAGLEQPIDTVFIDLVDNKHFDLSVETAVTFGFQGKLCIHPNQVSKVNAGFSPSGQEIKRARDIIKAFEEAETNGSASIQVNGYFVDYPIVEKARRVLSMDALIKSKNA